MLKHVGRMLTWCALVHLSACAITPSTISPAVYASEHPPAVVAQKKLPAEAFESGARGASTPDSVQEEEVRGGLERLQAACDSWRATGVYHDGREGDRIVNGIVGVVLAGGAILVSLRAMLRPKKEQSNHAVVALVLLLVAQAAFIAAHAPTEEEVRRQCELFPPLPLP